MKFKSTASYLLITFFMAAIVISFAFTGFTGFSSSAGSVAQVGSQKITTTEYQRAYNAELQRFSQMFGGKSLTAAQIKQFRLKEGALNRLIQQKLVIELANKMNIEVGTEEIKEDIKKAEYFLTSGKFDVNKYKSLLAANGFTPANFEQITIDTVKMRKISNIFESIIVSKNSVTASEKIKETTATVNAIEIDKSKLTDFLDIPKSKIKEFSSNKDNQSILTSLFNSMKNEFNKPERVNARHILIKEDPKNKAKALTTAKAIRKRVTKKNFAKIAGKETQDESGKGKKGGSLGWFTKGKMVPEFEKMAFSMKPGQISQPVKTSFGYHIIYVEKKDKGVTKTLDQVKDLVAKRHLQKTSKDELKKFQESIKNNLIVLLKTNNTKKIKKIVAKYNLEFATKSKVNFLDAKADKISLKTEDISNVLNNNNIQDVFTTDTPNKVTLFKATSVRNEAAILKEVNTKIEQNIKTARSSISGQIQSEIIDYLKEGSKVVTYTNLL